MRAVLTGAGGFIGRRVAERLLAGEGPERVEQLTLGDMRLADLPDDPRLVKVEGDLTRAEVRDALVGDGVDVLFHLAAVPGGAAEADYDLSRAVNLDASLALVEAAARGGARPRVVYSSTIAVFGAALPDPVDDATPLRPELTYGAHKMMMEVALADLTRRGAVEAMSLRLPGIVARPPGAVGMRSAFMSEVFHALAAGRPFVSPVGPEATLWLMSLDRVAANLLHAARVEPGRLPPRRVATLPALRLRMDELVAAVAGVCAVSSDLVSYEPDVGLQALFGTHPRLVAAAAEAAGFRHDGDAGALVEAVLGRRAPA